MQSPAPPMGQSLLKISLGLSGMVNTFCSSAIAAPLPTAEKTLPSPVSQSSLTDLLAPRSLSPAPFSYPDNVLNIQPLRPLSSSATELTPLQRSNTNLKENDPKQSTALIQAQPQTQICQSLQDCDRATTIEINAASATALGDLGEIEPAAENHSAHKQKAPLIADKLDILLPPEKQTEIAGSLDDLLETIPRQNAQPQVDDELGTIRVSPLRSRGDEDLGILRLLQTATAPPQPKPPIAFLTARLGYFNSENAFRLDNQVARDDIYKSDLISEQVYQSGLSFGAFPALSENTSLYAIAETSLGRFERASDRGYNEIELQFGVRQKLFPRTYAQVGIRNQQFYSRGYGEKMLGINYFDTVISHRSIFNNRTWLDSFYQARLGFASRDRSSRFRQTFTLALNYGINPDLRTSLVYQLDLEDYTQISRYDVYQQVIGTISYRLTPESQISVFGGTRFGNTSGSDPDLSRINLDDTFYGAGLTVNLPLF